MLVKIDFAALGQVRDHWRGIGVTLLVNWAVKPFSMALLGWVFIGWLFRPYLPAEQINRYIAGLILLAAAPRTAMVFVWSNLSGGEPHFTLSQVAVNDTIMAFAFAPIVALLLGLSAIRSRFRSCCRSSGLSTRPRAGTSAGRPCGATGGLPRPSGDLAGEAMAAPGPAHHRPLTWRPAFRSIANRRPGAD